MSDRYREKAEALLEGFVQHNLCKCTKCTNNAVQALRTVAEEARAEERKNKITGETSDGYHTFNDLYDHRVLLWINLCLLQHKSMTYLVEDHYEGWFLLGCETSFGQLSYHCPNKYLYLCKGIKRRHPEFDGHTSPDVIKRLLSLAERAIRAKDA